MVEWGKVPWTLWLHGAISIASIGLTLALGHNHNALFLAFAVVVTLGWTYLLFRGIRWVWIAMLALLVLSTISTLALGPRNWFLLEDAVTFALLLAPPTRRFFERPAAASEPR